MWWYTESGLIRFVENKEKEDEGIKTDTKGDESWEAKQTSAKTF